MEVADLLSRSVRASDRLGRLGGEELSVLLRGTNAEGAAILAEKLHLAVSALEIAHGGHTLRVTVSGGVSEGSPSRKEARFEDLYGPADAALYRAKQGCRDRVVIAETEGGVPASS